MPVELDKVEVTVDSVPVAVSIVVVNELADEVPPLIVSVVTDADDTDSVEVAVVAALTVVDDSAVVAFPDSVVDV